MNLMSQQRKSNNNNSTTTTISCLTSCSNKTALKSFKLIKRKREGERERESNSIPLTEPSQEQSNCMAAV